MKNITKNELNRIAKEYGYDPQYLEDQVLDLESDGIQVDAQDPKTTAQTATYKQTAAPAGTGAAHKRAEIIPISCIIIPLTNE